MDLLFSKYASPFIFLDMMIDSGRFSEFVIEFMELNNEKQTWEFYLHKVFDKSFDEFKKSVESRNNQPPTEKVETTVTDSKNILNNFIPTNRG